MTEARNSTARSVGAWLGALMGLMLASAAVAGERSLSEKFILRDNPKPLQPLQFTDGEGRTRSLSDFHGKAILLNIWATWCIPCRKEMPALDRLQAALGGSDFQVVPLSIDRGGIDVVRKFYSEIGVKKLGMFLDASSEVSGKLGLAGLPTTLLVDGQSRELGRLIGPAEWDTPENVEFMKCVITAIGNERSEDSSLPGAAHCGGRTVHFPAVGATAK